MLVAYWKCDRSTICQWKKNHRKSKFMSLQLKIRMLLSITVCILEHPTRHNKESFLQWAMFGEFTNQQIWDVELTKCWPAIFDVGPTLKQHRFYHYVFAGVTAPKLEKLSSRYEFWRVMVSRGFDCNILRNGQRLRSIFGEYPENQNVNISSLRHIIFMKVQSRV